MKSNRLYVLISLSFAMLSSGEHVAAMQSLPESSGINQSTVKAMLWGVAATSALVSSALYARTYLQNTKMNKPPQEVPVPKNLAETPQDYCYSDIATKINELNIAPRAVADLIAGYAAFEPKIIKRAPYYSFSGMRPTR